MPQAEGLEHLDRAAGDAVGLADLERAFAALDQARADAGEVRQLRGQQGPRRPAADDQNVDGVGQLLLANVGVAGCVAVQIELHVRLLNGKVHRLSSSRLSPGFFDLHQLSVKLTMASKPIGEYFAYRFRIQAMAKLDLDWLGVFVEVYKTQSVSRAAQRLGIEQASASIALGKLRRHFDDPLFTRTSAGMATHAQGAGAVPGSGRGAGAHRKGARRPRGLFAAAGAARVPPVHDRHQRDRAAAAPINHLQQTAPGLVVEAETISPDSRRRLELGEVDLAVGFTPDLEAGFYQQALFAQDFVCLASMEHPRVRNKLSLRAFSAKATSWSAPRAPGTPSWTRCWPGKTTRRVVLRVPSFLGVARIVAQTEFLVIVPRLLGNALASQERVQLLEPPMPLPSYKVKQHWHERFNADASSMWLRKTMFELFSNFDAVGAGRR